jgi:hypothetical protein
MRHDGLGEHIYVLDPRTGLLRLASINSDGVEARGPDLDLASIFPAVASDGRSVVFQSNAYNLAPRPTPNKWDSYVHDLDKGETVLLNRSSDGTPGNGRSFRPTISNDGRFVAFDSVASNLDGAGFGGAFVQDRASTRSSDMRVARLDAGDLQSRWDSGRGRPSTRTSP